MEQYWKIFTFFLLLVVAGIILFLHHDYAKLERGVKDTIRDTIVIYQFIEQDFDEDEMWD